MRNSKILPDHLYLQLAEGIEKMIVDEVLLIGDKLPSVRVLSEEKGISMGTAFQAYYHLEAKGLIESRPKSGYYVRFNYKKYPALPATIPTDAQRHEVSVNDIISAIYADITAPALINFAIAVPDLSLLPVAKLTKSVLHAVRHSNNHCIGYEDTQGNHELRKQVAKLSFNWGGKIKANEIVITNGCLEAITLCLNAVTKHGDTVAVECPTYFGILQAVENLGLKVVEITSDPLTGPDLNGLEKAIKKYPVKACVFIPNFNNPSGSCMPDEQKKKLVSIINKHHIPLIEDDIYGELYFGKHRPRTCKYYDTKGLVMHCSSVSKSLTPGYRIGWAIPGKFIEEVKQAKRIQNIAGATVTQSAIAHFLQNGRYEYHLKNLRRALYTQSLRFMQGVIDHFPADTKVSRPQGGFVLWVELNKKVDTLRLRAEAMKHNISIMPGHIFSVGSNYTNCIRISFGSPYSEDTDYGLMMLGKLIRKIR